MLEIDLASATKNIGFHNGTWQIYVPRDFANSELAPDHENKALLQSALCRRRSARCLALFITR